MRLDDLTERQQRVTALLTKLRTAAQMRCQYAVDSRISNAIDKLACGTFEVCVVGERNAGKSTLLCALLGAHVVPTSGIQATSAPTYVRYGESEAYLVVLQSGETIVLAETENSSRLLTDQEREEARELLEQYISETHNPSNEKGVVRVECQFPSELLKAGLVLVDTPGISGEYLYHNEITKACADSADAILFVGGGHPHLVQSEQRWLKRCRPLADKMFFLFTHCEELTDDELCHFEQQAVQDIARVTGYAERVYFLSPINWLEGSLKDDELLLEVSRFEPFAADLAAFLTTEKRAHCLRSASVESRRALSSLVESWQLETAACESPDTSVLDGTYLRLEQLSSLNRSIPRVLDDELMRIRDESQQELDIFFGMGGPESLMARMELVIQRQIEIDPSQAADAIPRELQQIVDQWCGDHERRLASRFAAAFTNVTKRIPSELQTIQPELGRIVSVDPAPHYFEASAPEWWDVFKRTSRYGIYLGVLTGLAGSVVGLALGGVASVFGWIGGHLLGEGAEKREIAQQSYRRQLMTSRDAYRRQCGQAISKFVQAASNSMREEIDGRLKLCADSLRQAVQVAEHTMKLNEEERQQRIVTLQQHANMLAGIEEDVQEVESELFSESPLSAGRLGV